MNGMFLFRILLFIFFHPTFFSLCRMLMDGVVFTHLLIDYLRRHSRDFTTFIGEKNVRVLTMLTNKLSNFIELLLVVMGRVIKEILSFLPIEIHSFVKSFTIVKFQHEDRKAHNQQTTKKWLNVIKQHRKIFYSILCAINIGTCYIDRILWSKLNIHSLVIESVSTCCKISMPNFGCGSSIPYGAVIIYCLMCVFVYELAHYYSRNNRRKIEYKSLSWRQICVFSLRPTTDRYGIVSFWLLNR